ncbi:hypothetical protein F2981_22220 (plasmid) [Sinorhizobium meliloti]|nr:hypothetical protein [Sinorhizobium meliloti]
MEESIVPALPYLFRSEEHMHKVMDARSRSDQEGFEGPDGGVLAFYERRRAVPSTTSRSRSIRLKT